MQRQLCKNSSCPAPSKPAPKSLGCQTDQWSEKSIIFMHLFSRCLHGKGVGSQESKTLQAALSKAHGVAASCGPAQHRPPPHCPPGKGKCPTTVPRESPSGCPTSIPKPMRAGAAPEPTAPLQPQPRLCPAPRHTMLVSPAPSIMQRGQRRHRAAGFPAAPAARQPNRCLWDSTEAPTPKASLALQPLLS